MKDDYKITFIRGATTASGNSAKEIEDILSQSGFSITENKTLADLNAEYFTPLGRTIPENHILNLEHFVVAHK